MYVVSAFRRTVARSGRSRTLRTTTNRRGARKSLTGKPIHRSCYLCLRIARTSFSNTNRWYQNDSAPPAAIEGIDRVIAAQFFDPRPVVHLRRRSKTLRFCRSLFKRGFGRAGASSAAWNAAHRSASRPKRWRSGNVSSAQASALSSTNSLTERCAAVAVDCRTRFAERVSGRRDT